MVLSLQRLTEFYLLEIQRGRCGLGNYVLRREVMVAPLPATVCTWPQAADPANIVATLRYGLQDVESVDVDDGGTSATASSSASLSASQEPPASDEGGAAQSDVDHPTTSSNPSSSNAAESNDVDSSAATVLQRAARIVQTGKLTLDVRRRVFIVDGTTDARLVRLFPQPTCSCPAQTSCYHVEAARLAVGMNSVSSNRRLNLTQLRKNKRKRVDKTSGRKRPRPNDVDVVPADDVEPGVAETLAASISAITTSSSSIPVSVSELDASTGQGQTETVTSAPQPKSKRQTESKRHAQTETVTSAKSKRGTRKTVVASSDDDDAQWPCLVCCEPYNNSKKGEKWIRCVTCERWAHVLCTGLNSKAKTYVCDKCESDDALDDHS